MVNKDSERNERMARVAPELESSWAAYPLNRKDWLDNAATLSNEDGSTSPAFIPYEKDPNFPTTALKADYVWGAGQRGFGYYHLLTRDAYKVLTARIVNKGPPLQCCCLGPPSNSKFSSEDYDFVAEIVYNRSIASTPDDMLAQKEAINIARGEANMHYNMSQNVQLVMML